MYTQTPLVYKHTKTPSFSTKLAAWLSGEGLKLLCETESVEISFICVYGTVIEVSGWWETEKVCTPLFKRTLW